jgi:hypothetical protein
MQIRVAEVCVGVALGTERTPRRSTTHPHVPWLTFFFSFSYRIRNQKTEVSLKDSHYKTWLLVLYRSIRSRNPTLFPILTTPAAAEI